MVLSLGIEYPPNIGKNIKVFWVTSKQYEYVLCTKKNLGEVLPNGNLLPKSFFGDF
jgi:hypothetical protein